ncbi:hypothetical protein [Treponema socranskii]|uniref:hypothetical protein n=1 Tax=Treponema socranskii TaxID=53419 RepID=UPI002871A8CD|nr:hypothetical protein [Treponema socranskii]MDR9860224.1 hypothetical protein [Treponema socranskii]
MFAVIPHSTEALILSRSQKASLSRLNAEAGKPCWVPLFPLWAFFNNFDYRTQQLKTIRNAIASFTIGMPFISNGEFFFPARLRFRNGEAACGKIIAGKLCGEQQTDDTKRAAPDNFNADNGIGSSRSAQNKKDATEEDLSHTVKKTNEETSSPRAAENGQNSFARFPRSCSVFRIADAEIGESKAANDENAADKIADKCTEDTSANTDDTDGAEIRTWRVHTSLWVKTEKRYRKTANDASNTSYRN